MRTVVLGGGIGGLSSAYYLVRLGVAKPSEVTLLESTSRLGGWIRTIRHQDGARYEVGPRTIRPVGLSGSNSLELVEELRLADRVVHVPAGHPSTQNRLVFADGRLHRLPNSLSALFVKTPPFSRPLGVALLRDLLVARRRCEDDTVHNFVKRRLGQDVADFAFDPLVRGVCAGDSKEISVKLLLKSLFEAEQKYGSIVVGMVLGSSGQERKREQSPVVQAARRDKWSVWSLDDGLESLPQKLASTLTDMGVDIRLSTPCTGLDLEPKAGVVHTVRGDIPARNVISALPAHVLTSLMPPAHAMLSTELDTISFVTVAVVNLEYSGRTLENEAFGLLVPSSQKPPILGVVFDTCSFPQGDRTVLTVMMGGKWFTQLFGRSPTKADLLQVACQQVKDIVGIREEPRRHNVEVLQQCIPQYTLGHFERVARIRSYIDKNELPLTLVGASFDGISVNDVIYASRKAVART